MAGKRKRLSATIYGEKYTISVDDSNYKNIKTKLGWADAVATDPNPTPIGALIDSGKIVPLEIVYQKSATIARSQEVYCTPENVGESLNPTSGLRSLKYGTFDISKATAPYSK